MTTIRKPIDVEDALQAAFNTAGFNACALPLPEHYKLPHVLVRCNGGSSPSFMQTAFSVTLECRAETLAGAFELANSVSGFMLALPGETVGSVPVYTADPQALPYNDPDPNNPTVPRVSCGWTVTTRYNNN